MNRRLFALILFLATCVTSLSLLGVPSALAQTPTAQHMEQIGHVAGNVTAVPVQGDYAYLGVDQHLQVLDISDPTTPVSLSQSVRLTDAILAVTVVENHAYVATRRSSLHIFDVTTPTAPVEVGLYKTSEYGELIFDVRVAGAYAYLAASDAGMVIVDISNPAAPTKIGSYRVGRAVGIALAGHYAYVTQVTDVTPGCACGLAIVDISDPTAPQRASYISTSRGATGVAISNSRAYLAADDLHVVDVADPNAPARSASHYTPGYTSDIAVEGSYAYVADDVGGLRVVNIENPVSPAEVGFYDTPGRAGDVAIGDGYIYLADQEGGLHILRYTGGGEPFISGRVINTNYYSSMPPFLVSLAGGYTDTTDSYGRYTFNGVAPGTYTVSVGYTPYYTFSPSARTVTVPPNGTAQNFTATPTIAWNVELLGQLDVQTEEMVIQDNYLFTVEGSGFVVSDLSDPANPRRAAQVSLPNYDGTEINLAVAEDYVYAAFGEWLYTYGLSSPSAPKQVDAYFEEENRIYDIALAGKYAYLATRYGFVVLNVEDPTNVTYAGHTYDSLSNIQEIFIKNDHLYSIGNASIAIFSLESPQSPTPLETLTYESSSMDSVGVGDQYLYIAWSYGDRYGSWSAVDIFDVTDPASPLKVGSYDTQNTVQSIAAEGDYLFLAEHGLRVLDASDLSIVKEVGFYLTNASEVMVAEGRIHVANRFNEDHTLSILRFVPPVPTSIGLDTLVAGPLSINLLVLALPFGAVAAVLLLRRRRLRGL